VPRVDALAVEIVALNDDFAQVHADAYVDAVVLRNGSIPLGKTALQGHGAFHGIDNAGELGQQSVAHEFEYPSVVAGNLGFEQFLAASPQALKSSLFVSLHHVGVTDDIGCKNCGKPPVHNRNPLNQYLRQ
jgi:hypothetical protein